MTNVAAAAFGADGLEILIVGGWIVLAVFLAFLLVLWTLLPFAVFGIKARLDRIAVRLAAVGEILAAMERQGMHAGGLHRLPEAALSELPHPAGHWGGFSS